MLVRSSDAFGSQNWTSAKLDAKKAVQTFHALAGSELLVASRAVCSGMPWQEAGAGRGAGTGSQACDGRLSVCLQQVCVKAIPSLLKDRVPSCCSLERAREGLPPSFRVFSLLSIPRSCWPCQHLQHLHRRFLPSFRFWQCRSSFLFISYDWSCLDD